MNTLHLLIGGTTKSGTTSLFQYLGDHPQVCPSSMKETRFFLDKEYPLSSKYRFEDGIEKYNEFFHHRKSEKILMEATPDYLYSKNTPEKIKNSIRPVKIIFVLREPSSRFISWYNFSQQIGKLPSQKSLQEYLDMQMDDLDAMGEQHLMALKQGNYSNYISNFYDYFSGEDIFIGFFEEMKAKPDLFMARICHFLSIDFSFYGSYNFESHNETMAIKKQGIHKKYIKLSFGIRKFTHNKKLIHGTLKKLKSIVFPLYVRLNSRKSVKTTISESVRERIDAYYAKEKRLYNEKYANLSDAQSDKVTDQTVKM